MAELFARLGVALGIGLLAGMQREHAKHQDETLFAGARTFSLIGLAGGLAAYTADVLDSAVVFAAALIVVAVLLFLGYRASTREHGDPGGTTEMAAVVVFLAGALAVAGELEVAAAVGVATTALLALKPQTRELAARLDRDDVKATVQFAILALLVLPVLPDETYGPSPWDAVSPFNVGLMAVFISGLSFVGYVLIEVVGARRGVTLTGLLGGLVSSTAATLSLSERSRESQGLARPLALGLLLAWAIMFLRVIVEVLVVNPGLLPEVWPSITAGAGAGLVAAVYLYVRDRGGDREVDDGEFDNPFSLWPALQFALLYGVILVVAKAASDYLGEAGVYASAVASGIADVDAITLSLSELAGDGAIADGAAATAIALAAATNTAVKAGMVVVLGRGRLRWIILPGAVAAVAATLGVAFLV